MSKEYSNYHKHSTYSGAFSVDSVVQVEEYFKRAKELGHTKYYTTEHGFGGSVFAALKLQKKYDIKVIFSMEIYVVVDNLEKDRSNNHMIVIVINHDGVYQMY